MLSPSRDNVSCGAADAILVEQLGEKLRTRGGARRRRWACVAMPFKAAKVSHARGRRENNPEKMSLRPALAYAGRTTTFVLTGVRE